MVSLHIKVGQALRKFYWLSKQQAVTEIVAESPEIMRMNTLEWSGSKAQVCPWCTPQARSISFCTWPRKWTTSYNKAALYRWTWRDQYLFAHLWQKVRWFCHSWCRYKVYFNKLKKGMEVSHIYSKMYKSSYKWNHIHPCVWL